MHVSDLFDLALLEKMEADGYVRRSRHPSAPLTVFNYSAAAQYGRQWNEVTRQCRGLVIDDDGFIVARAYPKFHNWQEHDADAQTVRGLDPLDDLAALDLDAPVEVTDKLDGSLGVLVPLPGGGFTVATRGSFTSEQAKRGTWMFEEAVADTGWKPDPALTYLFEIIYPENRVVVDYGDREALVLIGAVETATGRTVSPRELDWPGEKVETFQCATLREALELPPRDNREGVVVRFIDTDELCKIKQETYVRLHRVLTGVSARNLWEREATFACQHLITERLHWGSYVGLDPARAEEIIAEPGNEWLEDVPDEFHAWVRQTIAELHETVEREYAAAVALADELRAIPDRSERYQRARTSQYVAEIMMLANGGSDTRLRLKLWRTACPEPVLPFARGEDVS